MNEPNADKPKLIIDEDWKSQVERERAELRQASEAGASQRQADAEEPAAAESSEVEQPSAVKRTRGSQAQPEQAVPERELPPVPPASFPLLISMLGTQALMAMGQLDEHDPGSPPRLDYAKHYIDLLAVLEDKTKNNLSNDEAHMLGDWLHQLRLGYVEMSKHQK